MMRTAVFAASLLASAASWAASGQEIFGANCAMCHQADGTGVIGLAPSLHGTLKPYAASGAGHLYLSQILLSGMAGGIETEGHKFSGLMPSFADRLGDADIVAVLGYVLKDFNGVDAPVVAASDVAAARLRNPSTEDTHHARAVALAAR